MFIQVMQAKCSRPEDVRKFAESYDDQDAVGLLGGTFGVTDDGVFLGIVRFESAEAAAANSARPQTDAWAQEFAALLDGPVSFSDYDDVITYLGGGSDDAGFVQVVRGQVDDVARAKALLDDTDALAEMRPDIIGGSLAIAADGDYTEVVYFVDEASARAGEQAAPPQDVQAELAWMMDGAAFYDLRNPWFESAG